MMSMIDIIVLFLYKRKYNNYNMKNLAKYIRESKSDIEGETFTITPYHLNISKLENPDLKPFIFHQENEEKGYDKNPYLTKEYIKEYSNNMTIMITLMEMGMLDNPRDYTPTLDDDTEITIIERGWDTHIDIPEKTLQILLGEYYNMHRDEYNLISNNVDNMETYNLFDYYNKVANLIERELKEIFDFVQEGYLGCDGTSFYIGFDVTDGSILMKMPMFMEFSYIITTDTKKYPWEQRSPGNRYSEYYAVFRPTTFYGSDDTHFYNTKTHEGPCEIDLRLD